ncbi:glycosyltransferase, group 1 family protein [unidentified eubacterium SCB49]|nr:glycosyltransferase, group 1 family protein [unidentified eubacterium SCB49]
MKKTKIAHIANSVGGVNMWLRINIGTLDPKKTESFLIRGLEGSVDPILNRNGKQIKSYTVPIQREISIIKDFKAIRETIKILKKERPDVIHAHSAKGGIIARAASLFYKVNVLYTPHAFSFLSAETSLKRTVFIAIERVFKHFNSILLACSVSERNQGLLNLGYKKSRAIVMNNCVRPITISEVKEPKQFTNKPYICTVGRPSYQKNIEMLLAVVKVLKVKQPDIHLVVLGVGEYSPNKEAVETIIKNDDLSNNITLIPWIERESIFGFIKNAALYVSASRYEGLPYSVIEAMALKKACVVTDADGNRDLVKDGYNGYVVPQDGVEVMANRIFALLSDDEKRVKMEQHALLRFNTDFNIENNIEKLEAIYKKYS